MGDIAIGASGKDDAAKAEPTKRSRILRYDQVYDIQKSQVRLIKSIKADIKKQSGRKAVLIVRRIIDEKGFHTKTEVDIKSSRVAQVMQEINSDVEDVSLKTKPPVVPLEIFYHNKLALQDTLDEARRVKPPDDDLVADLTETIKFAVEEYATTAANLVPLLDAGEITWELLWTIFPPNVLVYRYHRLVEQDQILKLRAIRQIKRPNKSRYWELSCRIVADDGVKFGQAYEPFLMEIEEFAGARKITDLRIFPLSYHTEAAEIREAALIRGRRFAGLRETRVMETSGPAMFEKRDSRWEPHAYKFNSHGRTIIDPAGFRSFNPNIEFMPDVHKGLSRDNLTEEELLICTPFAFGFCFSNKKWGAFAMSRLLDVKWNDQAFQDLVMDKPAKMLVHSMVKQHSSEDDAFDDIISGKGKGIIALFSGPPGSGKTLTAEAVAEITKRPLYSVSAGDLGIDPQIVDQKLSEILEQSHKWNAVLLLDEADVFLQQRHPQDVKRNALVSIFLRRLEYYQGILILTTNRITQCDTAFESRVHISIQYPDLDEPTRRQIWATFLRRLKETQQNAAVDISDDDVSRLAKIEVNGRQIKNICSGARIMAKEMDEALSMSHFNLVLSVINLGFKVEPLAT